MSSGGLGPEVSPLLRTAAMPGVGALMAIAANRRMLAGMRDVGERLEHRGSHVGVVLQQTARALRPLEHPDARKAFLQSLRAVIDLRGQRVSARDRLYLLNDFPTLVVWGGRDNTIPIAHGKALHESVPGSHFVTLPGAAHFPHIEDPAGLADALRDWLASTEPAQIDDAAWGRIVTRSRPSSGDDRRSPEAAPQPAPPRSSPASPPDR